MLLLFVGWLLDSGIVLPGFSGVIDILNELLASSLFSNYIFWYLGVGLVGWVIYNIIHNFKK